ncbi:MAG: DUF433 domain-containing protein [Polyangiaceae bacterium]|nr:DUF433 domain-containing protein [Polyangiaceae bacterium]
MTRTRGVCGGRPTITGRRIQPIDVWSWLDAGYTVDQIALEYELTRAQVRLCKSLLETARAHVRDVDAKARRDGRRIPKRRWSR